MLHISIPALKTFVSLVETQSYQTTGKMLYMSHSSIVRHIDSIEDAVGGLVLQKFGHTRLATALGKQVYEKAKILLAAHDTFLSEVSLLSALDVPQYNQEVIEIHVNRYAH